jgi:hypothetical protein
MKFRVFWLLAATLLLFSGPAHASREREFIMSCTYGVLAGGLVGAASLAFEDKPGDNLQRVARGASLGLYAGIALGYYTVYYLPDQLEKKQYDPDILGQRASFFFPIASTDAVGLGWQLRF